jgi:cell division septal protein FtsQ
MQRKKTDERIREVKQVIWQRRKKKARVFIVIAVVAIIIYGAIKIKHGLTNILLNIKTFKVTEISITPPEARTLITGYLAIKERNLLFLRADELRKKIMRISDVEDCTVRKVFPSTVEIEVDLREPWVMLENENGLFFIDKTGRILAPLDNPEDFLRVQGVNISENSVAEKETWKLEVLKDIEKWYNFYNLQKHFSIEKIQIAKSNEIVLNTIDTRKIILIRENISSRFEKLKLVLDECAKNGTEWEYIDLRFEHLHVKHLYKK